MQFFEVFPHAYCDLFVCFCNSNLFLKTLSFRIVEALGRM